MCMANSSAVSIISLNLSSILEIDIWFILSVCINSLRKCFLLISIIAKLGNPDISALSKHNKTIQFES